MLAGRWDGRLLRGRSSIIHPGPAQPGGPWQGSWDHEHRPHLAAGVRADPGRRCHLGIRRLSVPVHDQWSHGHRRSLHHLSRQRGPMTSGTVKDNRFEVALETFASLGWRDSAVTATGTLGKRSTSEMITAIPRHCPRPWSGSRIMRTNPSRLRRSRSRPP
ncbi:hypothetical protein AERO9AM_20752 [Aeromicrobium sp. 9AM]|nr:hypothetical protein AERO9AM_20752 [Aeromicrobium sp. 9AM]